MRDKKFCPDPIFTRIENVRTVRTSRDKFDDQMYGQVKSSYSYRLDDLYRNDNTELVLNSDCARNLQREQEIVILNVNSYNTLCDVARENEWGKLLLERNVEWLSRLELVEKENARLKVENNAFFEENARLKIEIGLPRETSPVQVNVSCKTMNSHAPEPEKVSRHEHLWESYARK